MKKNAEPVALWLLVALGLFVVVDDGGLLKRVLIALGVLVVAVVIYALSNPKGRDNGH